MAEQIKTEANTPLETPDTAHIQEEPVAQVKARTYEQNQS